MVVSWPQYHDLPHRPKDGSPSGSATRTHFAAAFQGVRFYIDARREMNLIGRSIRRRQAVEFKHYGVIGGEFGREQRIRLVINASAMDVARRRVAAKEQAVCSNVFEKL